MKQVTKYFINLLLFKWQWKYYTYKICECITRSTKDTYKYCIHLTHLLALLCHILCRRWLASWDWTHIPVQQITLHCIKMF